MRPSRTWSSAIARSAVVAVPLWIGATEAQLRIASGEDALDLRAIAVVPFDGEHRDEAAAAFLTRLRAPVGA